ncbi:glycosyltransferase [Spirosoma jeollabukense]
MNIVMSADCFYPAQMGGPSNAIYWQAKALTMAGHDVTVVATSQSLPSSIQLDRWLTLDCGRVIYSKNPHFYLPIKHIWYGWQAIRTAELVHVNSLFYPASLAWVLMSLLLRKPIVWSPHGELSPVALRFRPRLKRMLLNAFRLFRSFLYFHATSEAETAHIRHHFGVDAQVGEIPNTMELSSPVARVARPYLLFMGRLHPIKAIDRLLDALSTSPLFLNSEYSLLIAGPVSDEAHANFLRERVDTLKLSARVTFLGAVYGEQKEQVYADARLLILPSHSENFGNVVIESLAQGTPVVASTNTPWQVLETERAGRWVANDPDALRQALDQFITMPSDKYSLFRTRALNLARQQFNSRSKVAQWEQFYTIVRARIKI